MVYFLSHAYENDSSKHQTHFLFVLIYYYIQIKLNSLYSFTVIWKRFYKTFLVWYQPGNFMPAETLLLCRWNNRTVSFIKFTLTIKNNKPPKIPENPRNILKNGIFRVIDKLVRVEKVSFPGTFRFFFQNFLVWFFTEFLTTTPIFSHPFASGINCFHSNFNKQYFLCFSSATRIATSQRKTATPTAPRTKLMNRKYALTQQLLQLRTKVIMTRLMTAPK